MARISKQDFEGWLMNPVTEEFRKMLKENLDKLAYGSMNNGAARDQIGTAINIGKFMATMDYYNMNYEFLTGEER
uniref:Uncharacterized protein n=1 Tax=viral metagenome TaxID=1070528 RepID=A0A6M3IRU3_9ZZZZ